MKNTYVVDTPIFLDILENDPEFGASSAALLDRYADATLHISAISYFELAPAFDGNRALQDEFLGQLGINLSHRSVRDVGPLVYRVWARYCRRVTASGGHGFPQTEQTCPRLLMFHSCAMNYSVMTLRSGKIAR